MRSGESASSAGSPRKSTPPWEMSSTWYVPTGRSVERRASIPLPEALGANSNCRPGEEMNYWIQPLPNRSWPILREAGVYQLSAYMLWFLEDAYYLVSREDGPMEIYVR